MPGPAAPPAIPEIQLRRRFRASPERVFRAWTQPHALKAWWCPPGWAATAIEIDLRAGGAFRIAMTRAGGGEVAVSGRFLQVQPPQSLCFTWCWEGAFEAMPETLVTVEFAEASGGTVLTLRHSSFADADLRRQHRSGWLAACDRLDYALTPPAMPTI